MKHTAIRYLDTAYSFEAWLRRPVYVMQVRTFRRALDLLGIPQPAPGCGIATRAPHGALYTFRALPGHRDANAQALRNAVAKAIRGARSAERGAP